MEHRLGHDCSLISEPAGWEREPVVRFTHPPHVQDTVSFCDRPVGEVVLAREHYGLIHLHKPAALLGLLRHP